MARPELGTKRQCQSCGAKFYDLNKDPILCPKCGATFQVLAPVAVVAPVADDDDETPRPVAADIVSLDDVVVDENAKDDVLGDDDIDLGDDLPDDDTFLEEEEDDEDDVTGLIDGDIETDEES